MTPDHRALARLPGSPSHWLHSYPAHLSRIWALASGASLRVRPIRHDDGELEERSSVPFPSNRATSAC